MSEVSNSLIDMVDVNQVQTTMAKIAQFQQVIQKTLKQDHDYGVIPGTKNPTLFKAGAEKILMVMGLRSEFEIIDSIRDFESGFFQYQVRCKLFRGDMVVTEGLGTCNTKETKYIKADPFSVDNTVLKMAKKRALVDATLLVASLSDVFTEEFDEDITGQPVSGQKKVYTDQDGTITKNQAKRMFALADGDADIVKQILNEYGYEKSDQVKKTEYEAACSKIEKLVAASAAPVE